jgi:tetratricopeptide (TPR) repeat protein
MPNWIRRKIMPDVIEAIRATDRSTHVFYITGKGGEGKTVFLRQIGMTLGSPDGLVASFPWSGILDLYHSDVNTNSGLEARLSKALETTGEFQAYLDERDAYAAKREAGMIGEELETERARMAEVFAQCMNAVTDTHRVTIALDTTERIQYELDEVQKLCQLEHERTTVRPWLLDQLLRWQNCVVLLVGRPEREPYLERALAEVLGGDPRVHYEHKELGGFDEEETQAYFKAQEQDFPAVCDLDENIRHRLGEVTEGRPIRLDLTLEVVQHGLGFDRLWRKVETSSLEEAHREIDRLLIEHVMSGEPDPSLRVILRYLAVARKGLDAELLHHLVGEWDLNDCQQRLDAIADRSFIKRRPDDGRLFLHDEMYDLCDRYLLLQPAEVQDLSSRVAKWCDRQIDALGDGREAQGKRRDAQVDSLLYRVRADPRSGYEWYARRVDHAIRGVEVGFDMRLRGELLAFLQSRSPIDQRILPTTSVLRREIACDCAARWVKRFMMRGQREKAVYVGERVLTTLIGLCPPDDSCFQLARADLAVVYAEALIYTGSPEEAVHLLKATIADLEGEQRPEILAQQDPKSFTGWRRNLVLGRGHNNLGYAYWMSKGQSGLALREFRLALPYFRASDLLEETANTDDNMGRVYALLYHRSPAESLVDDGLELRRQLAREYRYALSLNSRAIVHLAFGEPHRAHRVSEEALVIFERLGAQRGIGLARITLGRSLRHLGALWTVGVYGPRECDKFLSDATEGLKRAITIFEKIVEEPARLIEAYNELGCTYRERAALARSGDPESPLARSIAREAVQHLTTAIRLAEDKNVIQYVDSCEDLAQTYFQRQDFENTEVWLHSAEEAIPGTYKIEEGVGLRDIPAEGCVEEFWQQIGKIELLRGHLIYDRDEYERKLRDSKEKVSRPVLEQTMRHYTFAAAYFERYSERATGLETTFKQLYSRFKRCKIEDLRHVQGQVLPALAKTYALDPSTLGMFFEDTLGLALQIP